jgi:hypothetical protein
MAAPKPPKLSLAPGCFFLRGSSGAASAVAVSVGEFDTAGLDEEDTDEELVVEFEGELELLEEPVPVVATGVATEASSALPRSLLELFELETAGFKGGAALYV